MKTIDEAIEYAAENLQEGSRVVISIERHGYGVTFERDISHSLTETLDISEESMIDDVVFAVELSLNDQEDARKKLEQSNDKS